MTAPPSSVTTLVTVAGVMISLMVLLVPASAPTPAGAVTSPVAPVVPAVATYSVSGTVFGMPQSNATSTPMPILGDTVRAVPGSGCPITEFVPDACSPNATATTDSAGNFTLALPSGHWLIYSLPRAGFGGDSQNISINSANVAGVDLYAYVELSYNNATFVLPGYDSLSAYVNNSDNDTQVPVASYSADGVFYIDSGSDLVFYSFATETLESIAPWTQLYGNVANYVGDLENAFFLTFDGTYAYELGCTSVCTTTSSLEVRAVNISTGTTFVWNVAGVNDGGTRSNVQVDLIGPDGNDSTAALLLSSDTVDGYGLWNGTQYTLGTLPFFEANNAYWVPFLNAFVSVEADGQTSDAINEEQLQAHGPGFRLVNVYEGQITLDGVSSAFVDGLAFNLTLNEFSFAFGSYTKDRLVVATYSFADRVLQHEVSLRISSLAYGDPLADEHRLSVSTGAPVESSDYDPYFYNQSWAIDPFSDQYFDTDAAAGTTVLCAPGHYGGCQNEFTGKNYASGPVTSSLFLNASYGITPFSVNCGPHEDCPLLGTTNGTSLGTVYWLSPGSGAEFPFPASAPLEQPFAPPALLLAQQNTSSSVTVSWGAPADYPVLNYTLFWGFEEGSPWPHVANLSSVTTSFAITDISSGSTVCFGVEAADLHGEGPMSVGCAVVGTLGTLPAVSGVTVTGTGTTNATVVWSLPTGVRLSLLNVFLGFSCDHWQLSEPASATSTEFDLTGLTPSTSYCAEVEDIAPSGAVAFSAPVTFATLSPGGPPTAPSGLFVAERGRDWSEVGWTNPNGTLVGDQVYLATYGAGTGCEFPLLVSEDASGTFSSWNYSGLTGDRTYCATVVAVGAGGASPPSAVLYLLALQPSGLTVLGVSSSTVSLEWTNIPAAPIANVTVYVGSSDCAFTRSLSAGVTEEFNVSGLQPSTAYCLAVSNWIATGAPSQSDLAVPFANLTTLPAVPCDVDCGPGPLSFSNEFGLVAVSTLGAAAAVVVAVVVGNRRGPPPSSSRP